MNARVLALLAALAAGALLVGWAARGGGPVPDAAGMVPDAEGTVVKAAGIAAPPEGPVEDSAPPSSAVGPRPATARHERRLPDHEGLLVFPPGTPTDESVRLFVSGSSSDERRPVEVSSEGTFRAPGELATPLSFALEARYLRLEGIEPERDGERWVLRPRLGARVVGRVVAPWSSEQPVRFNAYVGRLPVTVAEWDDLDGPRWRRRPTYLDWSEDQVGEFVLDALPAGVPLVVEAHAYLARPARERMTLAPGETRRVVFTPDRAVTLAGKLVSAVATDLSEYVLRVHHLQEDGSWSTVHSELTVQSGEFRIGGLPPGRLCLTAQDGSSRAELVLDAVPGDVEGLVLEVDRPSAIAGFVAWSDGEPVRDPVEVVAESDRPGYLRTGTDDGAFLFDKTATGATYRVRAELAAKGGNPISRSATVLVTAPAEAVRLELPRPASLEGVVTTDAGTPARFAHVGTALGAWASAGEDGHFRLLVPPGEHRLAAYAEGRPPSEVLEVVLRAGESIDGLELRLASRGASLRGEILDASGAPVTVRMRVSVDREPPAGTLYEPFETSTDEDGTFELADLPSGPVSISALQSPSVEGDPVDVDVGEGSLLVVRVRRWHVAPEHVVLAEGGEHFVSLTASRTAD